MNRERGEVGARDVGVAGVRVKAVRFRDICPRGAHGRDLDLVAFCHGGDHLREARLTIRVVFAEHIGILLQEPVIIMSGPCLEINDALCPAGASAPHDRPGAIRPDLWFSERLQALLLEHDHIPGLL